MAEYQQVSSGIGNLLRMIKEQRSQGPIIPPSADVASPIRETVQGPVKTPESPETNRVISVRPEQSPGGNVGPVVGPLNPSVSIGASPANPIGPVANRPVPTPVPTPSQPVSKGGVPPVTPSSPSVGTPKTVGGPNIGTVIGAYSGPVTGLKVQGTQETRPAYGTFGMGDDELKAKYGIGVKPGSIGRVGTTTLDPRASQPIPTQTPPPDKQAEINRLIAAREAEAKKTQPKPQAPSIGTQIWNVVKKGLPFSGLW